MAMMNTIPLACFLSMIRPPGVQFDNALLQIAPVDKTKCPLVRDITDVNFQLYTRLLDLLIYAYKFKTATLFVRMYHLIQQRGDWFDVCKRYNPTQYQELVIDDDEKLLASHLNFHDKTVIFFHAFMEMPSDGSGVLVREAYMLRGDVNMIMVDASQLEAGPWYFTAADNTWYIGRFAAKFIDYLVSRGLDLSKTHLIGHSLGAQAAGVAGAFINSGRVSRITGLDPALPLFAKLPLEQRLDPSDADFVDVIHTDAGIFGVSHPTGHADFFPNGGISPQPGCELEVVLHQQQFFNKFFCSHWRSYMFYAESVLRPDGFIASPCESWRAYKSGGCAISRRKRSHMPHMGYAAEPTICTHTISLALPGESSTKLHGYYTFHLQPVNSIEKKLTKRTDIHQQTTQTAQASPTQNNMRVNIYHDKKTKALKDHEVTEDTNYKIKGKHSTFINTKDGKTRRDMDSSKYVTVKDTAYKMKDKHSKGDPTENKKLDIESMYDEVKDLDTDEDAMGSSFDLTAAEADLESTLTRIKIINTDKKHDKTKHKTYQDFTKRKTVESFQSKRELDLNLKETFSHSQSDLDSTYNYERSHVKKRQKRFINLFQKSESVENENFLFRILEFLNKNRRHVIPVFTVMREINTLVKSANGELNHSTKERNNYIGHNPPVLPLATYNLELGSDSKVKTFVKRLLGLKVEGDKLSVTGKK